MLKKLKARSSELRNAVERAVVLTRSESLSEEDFPIKSIYENNENQKKTNVDGDILLYKVEKPTILKVLEATGGNKSEAARRLGITRKTLHKKLKAYATLGLI